MVILGLNFLTHQYLLGLSFLPSLSLSQLENFRNVFLPTPEPLCVLPLTAPFVLGRNYQSVVEEASEILGHHLWESQNSLELEFFEVQFSSKEQRAMYLVPKLPDELHFLLEELEGEMKHWGKSSYKRSFVPRLLVGEFQSDEDFVAALTDFRESTPLPLQLKVEGFYFYKKTNGPWFKSHQLLRLQRTSLVQARHLAL